MTMLDRMRRHKNWLKWSLALVCLAFVVFYIPDFLRTDTGALAGSNETIARVEDRAITAGDFRRTYQAQLAIYRGAYGGSMNERILRQLGIEQQILQQMIDERAALAEADRLGIRASDEEVRERIFRMPGLQENGRFIGEERYRRLLGMQRPPVTPAEFEANLRQTIVLQKLRAALSDWMVVSDAEVDQEYRRKNEKVKLELVTFLADKFRDQVSVSDDDLAKQFEAHKSDYRVGEKRKIRFLLLDAEAARAKTTITTNEIERAYNESIEQYSSPEQVRASHVLFKTQGKDEATVRSQAESVLKLARGGADFAELARKYSEDEATAKLGGDLDYFGRGRMVPEFDQVAFSAEPGSISDLVKTQFGFHIIKVVDKKAGSAKPLSEVRQQISDQLTADRAQQQVADLAATLEQEIRSPSDLDEVAKARGLTVQESGFFQRDEPIAGLGFAPEVAARAFELKDGESSGAIRVARGQAFVALVGKQAPYVPKLNEVRERVREDVVREKAKGLAREKAAGLVPQLRAAADFTKAARLAGLDPKPTELIPRDSPLPDIGVSSALDRVAFALPIGSISDPVTTDNGAAIIRVVERRDVTPTDLAAGREQFKADLLTERRNRFFSAYMVKAKQRMKIVVDRETVMRTIGTS